MMSSTLREFLLASGVSQRDLADAIRESRGVVRGVSRWSGLAARAAAHIAEKAKPESKVQRGALLAAGLASTVASKAGQMLGRVKK